MSIIKIIICLSFLILQGCSVVKVPQISASDKDNGFVRLSYDQAAFDLPKVQWDQGMAAANRTCKSWGYAGATTTPNPQKICTTPTNNGGCLGWRVEADIPCDQTQQQIAEVKELQAKQLESENQKKEANSKLCTKIQDITQDMADQIAKGLEVSSSSIVLREAFVHGPICCVTLDTPKGPVTSTILKFIEIDGKLHGWQNHIGFDPKRKLDEVLCGVR
jgi:hypothetical protein